MKITLIRESRESGKETLSTCEADAWIDRIKTETKEEHVTRLRSMLLYTNPDSGGYYEHIDKLPRIYPSVEFGRSRNNGRKLKHYNGIVMLEVNHLAGLSEVELVKRQAALLPQTWAAFAGSSGRSVKIWVKFALSDKTKNSVFIIQFTSGFQLLHNISSFCFQKLLHQIHLSDHPVDR